MNFFEHQDQARRHTTALLGYYVLAVIMIMIAVYLVFAGMLVMTMSDVQQGSERLVKLWNPQLFTYVMGGTLLIVVLGSLFKIAQLSQGGKAVAEMLGGRLLNHSTSDPDEKKILNVVEEMAIASGTPVPPVYMMEREESINAFAAGFSPTDAVIGVTRGCIQQLSRDELQGVIAHEFSHILNGDMRLNIRLMGVLHGILVIALLGYWIMRSGAHSGGSKKGGAGGAIALGLGLMVVGYIGVFFGNLIKSAVSRQREFLADASAVQFTRNPEGISGALKKIGGIKDGSKLKNNHAEEASHLFFSNGLKSSFLNAMATHPPLVERIKRIDPSFAGDFKVVATAPSGRSSAAVSGFASGGNEFAIEPDAVVESIGAPTPEHVSQAVSLLSSIPEDLTNMAHEPFGARAIIYCMLLNEESQPRSVQLKRLADHADPAVYAETMKAMAIVEEMDSKSRMPLIDLAINSLKQLSESQYHAFMSNIDHLIRADEQVDLFEYTLQKIITRHLEPTFYKPKKPVIQFYDINGVERQCVDLLSCLAHWGADDDQEAAKAFSAGLDKLHLKSSPAILPSSHCGLQVVEDSLTTLDQSSPAVKRNVINACVSCIAVDGKVTVHEAELMRSVADALGCPVPPILN
ncbi:hypothetical protein BVX97_01900 [bacterium E08(2017)]|nr:hypothetical protein BVX97_01900 [bacterium E08(2017)]